MTADAGIESHYWSQNAADLSAALGSGPGGLASAAASAQFRLVGPNSVDDVSRLSAIGLLVRQFESPLVLILVFAAAISLVLQQWIDAAIILTIVLGSTLLGFYQEYRAEQSLEALKSMLPARAPVRRSAVTQEGPSSSP